MHSLICAILAASYTFTPSGHPVEGIDWGRYESHTRPVSVTTNVVVCLQITKEYIEPCPCPDGFEGCCVAHYRKDKKTTYTPVKHLSKFVDDSRGVGIKMPILKELVQFAEWWGAKGEIVPIRMVGYDGNVVCSGEPVGWFLLSKARDFVSLEENRKD